MKSKTILLGVLWLMIGCTEQEAQVEQDPIRWLTKTVDENSLIPMINQYVMKDSIGGRVGAMSFSFFKSEDNWTAIDTSLFDDGSIYETANMQFNLESEVFTGLETRIAVPNANVSIDLNREELKIVGSYVLKQDTIERINRVIDSAYVFDVFREEIYMMLHTLTIEPGDTLGFRMLLSNTMSVVPASIHFEKKERIEVGAGTFDCTVVYLNTGGIIDNRIWIAEAPEKKLVKFHVPGPKLDIELVDSTTGPR